MRENYWNFFAEAWRVECYLSARRKRAELWNAIVTIACCLASAISIADWALTGGIRLAFAVATAIAQLVLAVNPNLPFARQIEALKYLLPELRAKLVEYRHFFHDIDLHGYSDDVIALRWQSDEQGFTALCDKYIGDTVFPYSKSLALHAETERNDKISTGGSFV